ncbi:hypothetical protein [Nostoc sp.]
MLNQIITNILEKSRFNRRLHGISIIDERFVCSNMRSPRPLISGSVKHL